MINLKDLEIGDIIVFFKEGKAIVLEIDFKDNEKYPVKIRYRNLSTEVCETQSFTYEGIYFSTYSQCGRDIISIIKKSDTSKNDFYPILQAELIGSYNPDLPDRQKKKKKGYWTSDLTLLPKAKRLKTAIGGKLRVKAKGLDSDDQYKFFLKDFNINFYCNKDGKVEEGCNDPMDIKEVWVPYK